MSAGCRDRWCSSSMARAQAVGQGRAPWPDRLSPRWHRRSRNRSRDRSQEFDIAENAKREFPFVRRPVERREHPVEYERIHGSPFDRSGGRGTRDCSRAPRSASGRFGRRRAASSDEVLVRLLRLIVRDDPSRVLRLGRTRERLTEIRANELSADAEIVRKRLRPERRVRVLEVHACHVVPPFVRSWCSLSIARSDAIERDRTNVYTIFTFADHCQPPPATPRGWNQSSRPFASERSEQAVSFSTTKEASYAA